jgi:hypothetical protein
LIYAAVDVDQEQGTTLIEVRLLETTERGFVWLSANSARHQTSTATTRA